jgi:hypothetical protein
VAPEDGHSVRKIRWSAAAGDEDGDLDIDLEGGSDEALVCGERGEEGEAAGALRSTNDGQKRRDKSDLTPVFSDEVNSSLSLMLGVERRKEKKRQNLRKEVWLRR